MRGIARLACLFVCLAAPGCASFWRFALEQLCDRPAEMTAQARPPWPWAMIGLGAFLAAALGVTARSLFRRLATSPPGGVR